MIQVCTRLWPEPGPRTKAVPFPASPTGATLMPILEPERRKNHIIDMVNCGHGLMPIAVDCLHYQENERPSSEELCQRLADLKATKEYRESVEQVEGVQNDIAELERQMGEVQAREVTTVQQLREENQRLQDEILSKDFQLHQQERQIQSQLRQLQGEIQSKDTQLRQKAVADSTVEAGLLDDREAVTVSTIPAACASSRTMPTYETNKSRRMER